MAVRKRLSRVQKRGNLSLANQFNNGKSSGKSQPLAMIQRARLSPESLTSADLMHLQKTIGNQAVGQLMAEAGLNATGQNLITNASLQTIQKNSDKTIQMVVNSAILNKAALTPVNFAALLALAALRNYIWRNEPVISSGNNTFTLRWDDAIAFAGGESGTLYIHMHEGVLNFQHLAGGGAWIDGGALGHGVNIDNDNVIKQTCVAWIEDSDYAEGFFA